jgi:hypothetical protein
MPFYARLGFAEIPADRISEALRSILDQEVRSGLDARRRVAMRWRSLTSIGAASRVASDES